MNKENILNLISEFEDAWADNAGEDDDSLVQKFIRKLKKELM